MKAIETTFDNRKFRSRAEARWAVFFKHLEIEYEYEKEGFDLSGVWYLPDFWIPASQCWIEIKGQEATGEEREKAIALAKATNHPVFIFDVPICVPGNPSNEQRPPSAWGHEGGTGNEFGPYNYWCQCPNCGKLGITLLGNFSMLPCQCLVPLIGLMGHWATPARLSNWAVSEWWRERVEWCMRTIDTPPLVEAYTAAAQARFEHGRSGN